MLLFERAAADLLTLHTSELTLAEVLVDPIKLGDSARASAYIDLLKTDEWLEVMPITREILIRSSEVRAGIGNKLPDAIHVATAAACSCNVLLSSDRRLRLPEGIKQIRLEDAEDLDLWP